MTNGIPRRIVLRAAGAALALPWLESLPVVAARSEPRAFPKRFAVLFMGNGVSGNHWWARGNGAAMTLSRSLQPLAPLKHKITVINGLFNQPAVGIGIHPAQTGNLLSGVPIGDGPIVRAGISIDQLLANRMVEREPFPEREPFWEREPFRRATPLASLVLSCEEPATGFHDTGFSMAYSSHISWQHTGTPAPVDTDPARAFDRVFANDASGPRRSILDRVKARGNCLERYASASDRHTLDAYFTNVREVEARVDRIRGGGTADLRERIQVMCDIVALAFQSGRARIASLLLARDLSSLSYPFLDVHGDHHSASHDDLSDAYERVVRFHVSRLAGLAAKLDAMPEGDGTVLDNCCLLWLSNMWSGWKHDNRKLPIVTVGGLGGTIETGRSLEYLYAGDENRRLCSLYLSIIDRMGVTLDRFGDAETRLDAF